MVWQKWWLIAGNQTGRTVETPLAHAASIDVNEIRMRIISHAAATQSERRPAQPKRVNPGHPQIDRFRLNVQAVLCDAGSALA